MRGWRGPGAGAGGAEQTIPGPSWAPSRRSELIELNILSKLVGLNGLHQVLAGESSLLHQPARSLNIKPQPRLSSFPKMSEKAAQYFSWTPISQKSEIGRGEGGISAQLLPDQIGRVGGGWAGAEDRGK